jgi:hypothetical protein
MGSFKRLHVFDPLDMEIIDLVYEVAWEQYSLREPTRNTGEDEERQSSLRKRIFALAGNGGVDFDTLLDTVLASLPKPLGRRDRATETPFSDVATKYVNGEVRIVLGRDAKRTCIGHARHGRCPLWVISGHCGAHRGCPLCPMGAHHLLIAFH